MPHSYLTLEAIKGKINKPEWCSHISGDTPQSFAVRGINQRTAIVWHTLNTGVEFGICLNCQRQFWPSDPDYSRWRKQESYCFPSTAGKEQPLEIGEIPDYIPRRRNEMEGSLETDFDVLFPDDSNVLIIKHGIRETK